MVSVRCPASGKSKGKAVERTQRPLKAHKRATGYGRGRRRRQARKPVSQGDVPVASSQLNSCARHWVRGPPDRLASYNSPSFTLSPGIPEKRGTGPAPALHEPWGSGLLSVQRRVICPRLLKGLPAGCVHCGNSRCLPRPATAERASGRHPEGRRQASP